MNKFIALLIVLLLVGAGYIAFRSSQPEPANPETRSQDINYPDTGEQGVKTEQSAIGSGASGADPDEGGSGVNVEAELSGLYEQQRQIKSTVDEILSLDRETFSAMAGNNGGIESSLVVVKTGVAAMLSRIGQLTEDSATDAALSEQISALKASNAELSTELSLLKNRQDERLTALQARFEKEVAQHKATRDNFRVSAEESKKQMELANQLLQQKDLALQAEQKVQQLGRDIEALKQSTSAELSQKDLALQAEQQKLQQLRRDIEVLKQGTSAELSQKDLTLQAEQQKLQQLGRDIEALKQDTSAELSQKDLTLQVEQQKSRQLRRDIEALKQSMSLELSQKDGMIQQLRDTTTTIQLGSDVVFALGSTNLSAPGRAVLSRVTELIENYPEYLVSLEGHTDNIPIRAERQEIFPSNWELSAARASAAARFLVAQGVDPNRLRVVGYGSNRAIADNDSEQGRAQNRRLEIRFSPKPRIRLAQ